MGRLFNTLIVSWCLIAGANAVAEDTYDIKFDRDLKVGHSHGIEIGVTRYAKTTVEQPGAQTLLRDTKQAIKINGIFTVLKLGDKKQIVKYQIKNERCVAWRPRAGIIELFPKGAVIIVERVNGEAAFRLDGKAADKQTQHDLSLLLELIDCDVTFDEAYGSKQKRSVNASWPVNRELYAKGVKHYGYVVAPEDVKGVVTLKKVGSSGGIRYQQLHLDIDFKSFKYPFEGFKILKSNCAYQLTADYPFDRTKPCLNLNMKVEIKMEVARNGQMKGANPQPAKPMTKVHDVIERYEKITLK